MRCSPAPWCPLVSLGADGLFWAARGERSESLQAVLRCAGLVPECVEVRWPAGSDAAPAAQPKVPPPTSPPIPPQHPKATPRRRHLMPWESLQFGQVKEVVGSKTAYKKR